MAGDRQMRRRASKEAERAAAAALRKVDQATKEVNAYQSGYLDGYLKAIDDITAAPVVARVAARIVAVMNKPQDQAAYTLGIVKNVLTPAGPEALLEGLKQATETWLAKREAARADGRQPAKSA
jgi:hypothetical protein